MMNEDQYLDILGEIDVAKNHIKGGDINQCLSSLENLLQKENNPFFASNLFELELIISRYNNLQNRWMLGMIEDSFWNTMTTRIIATLLAFIDSLISETKNFLDSSSNSNHLKLEINVILNEKYNHSSINKVHDLIGEIKRTIKASYDEIKLIDIKKGSISILLSVHRSNIKKVISLLKSGIFTYRLKSIKISNTKIDIYQNSYLESFGLDFSNAIFKNTQFKHLDFKLANFQFSTLNKVEFTASQVFKDWYKNIFNPQKSTSSTILLEYSNFNNCHIVFTKYIKSSLKSSIFKNSTILNSSFQHTDLENSDYSYSNIEYCKVDSSNLKKSKFNNTYINRSFFKNSTFQNSKLDYSLFDSSVFEKTDLRNISLIDCKFINTIFKKCIAFDFQKEDFLKTGADIKGIDFQKTDRHNFQFEHI